MSAEAGREAIEIERTEADTLLIALSGHFNNIAGQDRFAFADFAKKVPASKILTKDLFFSWYHKGIEGISTNIIDTAEFFVDQIEDMGAEKVALVGGSSSGYAALLFGLLVDADFVYAFCPQTFLDERNRLKAGDARWEKAIEAGEEYFQNDFLDLKNVFDMFPDTKTKFRVYFATFDELDRIHAEHIDGCPGVKLHSFDKSDLGQDYPLISSVSTHTSAALQILLRMRKDDFLVKQIGKDLDLTPIF